MNGQWHGGKGSKPRPLEISSDEFDANWERTMSGPTLREQYDNYVKQAQEQDLEIKTFAKWLLS